MSEDSRVISQDVHPHSQSRLATLFKTIVALVGTLLVGCATLGLIALVTGLVALFGIRVLFPNDAWAPEWIDWVAYAIWLALFLVTAATCAYFGSIGLRFRGLLHWVRGYGRKSICD